MGSSLTAAFVVEVGDALRAESADVLDHHEMLQEATGRLRLAADVEDLEAPRDRCPSSPGRLPQSSPLCRITRLLVAEPI